MKPVMIAVALGLTAGVTIYATGMYLNHVKTGQFILNPVSNMLAPIMAVKDAFAPGSI